MCSGGSVGGTALVPGACSIARWVVGLGLAYQRGLQSRLGQPELLQRRDGAHDAGGLRARIGQQLEHADQHAVVAQQVFLADALLRGQDVIAVVRSHIPGGAVGRIAFPQV